MHDDTKDYLKNIFKIGTAECAIFMALCGLVVGILILLFGFWSALLVTIIVALFAFIGGVKDKKECVGKLINRIFPAKSADNFPGIEHAVKRATATPPMHEYDFPPFKAPDGQDDAQQGE